MKVPHVATAVVTPLDPTDDAVVVAMHAVLQSAYHQEAQLIGASVFPPLSRTQQDLKEAATQFFGCWDKDRLVALIEIIQRGSRLSIDSLVVAPDCVRQGYASRLLWVVLNGRGWENAMVETALDNAPALALYRKFGFKPMRTWQTVEGIFKQSLGTTRTSWMSDDASAELHK